MCDAHAPAGDGVKVNALAPSLRRTELNAADRRLLLLGNGTPVPW